jgi:hypothetical protein
MVVVLLLLRLLQLHHSSHPSLDQDSTTSHQPSLAPSPIAASDPSLVYHRTPPNCLDDLRIQSRRLDHWDPIEDESLVVVVVVVVMAVVVVVVVVDAS